MKEMNILYAIDEGKKDFSRYLGVSVLSLLEKNKEENVHIYILSQYIEESNKQELIRIVKEYGKKITFSDGEIVPEKYKEVLSVSGQRSFATYYRFFFLNCFDVKDRILYLDCDTIINKNLSDFFYQDFDGNTIVGCSDVSITRCSQMKKYGLKKYVNAGVLLINIDEFKKVNLLDEFKKINSKFGHPNFNDQDYINIIFKDGIKLCEKLQLIACFHLFSCYTNYSDRYIIHTTAKPNAGFSGYCPREIEKLFNKYLERTKWKTRIGYKKEFTFREKCNFCYNKIKKYSSFITARFFGGSAGAFLDNMFDDVGMWIGGVLKAIKFFK